MVHTVIDVSEKMMLRRRRLSSANLSKSSLTTLSVNSRAPIPAADMPKEREALVLRFSMSGRTRSYTGKITLFCGRPCFDVRIACGVAAPMDGTNEDEFNEDQGTRES